MWAVRMGGAEGEGSGEERDLAIKIKNKREAFMGL